MDPGRAGPAGPHAGRPEGPAARLGADDVVTRLGPGCRLDLVLEPDRAARWPDLAVVPLRGDPPLVLVAARAEEGPGAFLRTRGTFRLEGTDAAGRAVAARCEAAGSTVTGGAAVVVARVLEGTGPPEPADARSGVGVPAWITTGEEAHRRARELVLLRHYLPDTTVEPDELAHDLRSDPGTTAYAMTRLSADGLVRRDPLRGYVVVPLDVRESDATFDARCAIEVGVLETSLHRVADHHLTALRGSYDGMARELVGDRFVDFERYLEANVAFHREVVGLGGSAPLVDAFGHLGIKEVMTRSFGWTTRSSQSFLEVQGRMLAGIERRDLPAAREATVAYRDLAKQRVRTILGLTGGRL
ncbi:hypothetical protein GCM10009737_01280 [Nocardioides lentus]|uniref:GntR C-terminal domain-containing protein n=1 Tax=Nocardioides lentus TaxID=338077 RepID=A0ABN2NVP4_9ACTN